MEAIRLTLNSARLASIINLPKTLRDREVEVIVMQKSEDTKEWRINSEQKSMMGCLSQYANPSLIEQEKDAWERAATEKYLEKINDGRS
jgi:hypothetical protein